MSNIKKYLKYLITFKFIKILSYISARSLQLKLNESHKNKYLYYYGFQIFYGSINKGLLLILVGLVLHILPQILVVTLSFASLRVFVGGLHFNSYTKCSWISLLTLVTLGLLSKYMPYNNYINICIFSTLFVIAVTYAPVEHKNRPLNEKEKIKFKHISLFIGVLLYSIQLLVCNNNISNSIMYGVLLASVIALPPFQSIE